MQALPSLPSILPICHPQHQQTTTTSPPTQSQHTHLVCQQPIDPPHWQTLLTESFHLSTLLFRLITSAASLNYSQNASQDPSPSTSMACPFCRFLAWLQHKLDVRAQNKATQARDAARTERIKNNQSFSYSRWWYEPPRTPFPPPGDTETLETLRARIPPRSNIVDEQYVFRPPEPTETMEQACEAAAGAVQYPIFLAITEPEPKLVAARAVQAVATAISTEPTYPVYIAVVTMAESIALIHGENQYTKVPPGIAARRRLDLLDTAVDAGMAAYDEGNAWPSDGHEINGPDSQAHSDSDSDWTPILNHPYETQSSGGHSSPSR